LGCCPAVDRYTMEGLIDMDGDNAAFDEGVLDYSLLFCTETTVDLAAVSMELLLELECITNRRYIWHRASPTLVAHQFDATGALPCRYQGFQGRVDFGDNIDDEWLVLAWLIRATRKYSDLQAVLHVHDTDGDVLLIEAADALPSYVDPDDSSPRTFVINGSVHYIPPLSSDALDADGEDEDDSGAEGSDNGHEYSGPHDGGAVDVPAVTVKSVASVATGAQFVLLHRSETALSDGVQDLIATRIDQYPKQALGCMHTCRCELLEPLARILSVNPQLISASVDAFYNRDSTDVATASKMLSFPPAPLVSMSVRMTRNLFCKLDMQRYIPPKKYRSLLPADVLESLKDPKSQDPVSCPSKVRWYLMGSKIACGFEIILLQRSIRQQLDGYFSKASVQPEADPKFQAYLASLTGKGFFADCKTQTERDSKRQAAAEYFFKAIANGKPAGNAPADAVDPLVQCILTDPHLCAQFAGRVAAAHATGAPYPWPPPCGIDDSIEWLSEGPTALNMFDSALGVSGSAAPEMGAGRGAEFEPLQQLLTRMQQFMSKESDYKGVEGSVFEDVSAAAELDDEDGENADENDGEEITHTMLPIGRELTMADIEAAIAGEVTSPPVCIPPPPAEFEMWPSRSYPSGMRRALAQQDAEVSTSLKSSLEPVHGGIGALTTPADVQYNLLVNLSRSVSAQQGASGPASNVMAHLTQQVPSSWWEQPVAGEDQPAEQEPDETPPTNIPSTAVPPAHVHRAAVLEELQTLD
jgi:hypothetical protein